ncbi:MAG: hypothetical protein ACR2LQ_12370 [Acidimicrobiales bacterium]
MALLAACSGSTHNAAPSTSSSTSAASAATTSVSSTTTTLDEKEAVKTAYLAYWQMVDRLVHAPDPNDGAIESLAEDPAASVLRTALLNQIGRGEIRGLPANAKYSHRVDAVTVDRSTASVLDCVVDDKVVFDREGNVRDDGVSTGRFKAELVRRGARWLVRQVDLLEQAPGVSGCAA